MPKRATAIQLSEREQAALLSVTKRHKSGYQLVLRARIVLAVRKVEERLADAPRSGAPARISTEQRCQMELLACEAPGQSGRPISQWSGREIAEEMIRREIVEHISRRHAARLLKKGGFQPHRFRY